MKSILFSLLFTPFLLIAQSIYPLQYTFDDDNLYISTIDYREDKLISIELLNVSGDGVVVGLFEYPNDENCPKVKTINQVFHYEIPANKTEHCDIYKNALETGYLKDQDIIIDNLRILLFQSNVTKMTMAMIFNKSNFAGIIFDASFDNKQFFNSFLKTIKENKDTKNIDRYLSEGNKSIKKGKEHFATKNLISAILLEPNHKDIKSLYQKIYDYKKFSTEINWEIPKFLNNNQTNATSKMIEELELLEQNRKQSQ